MLATVNDCNRTVVIFFHSYIKRNNFHYFFPFIIILEIVISYIQIDIASFLLID